MRIITTWNNNFHCEWYHCEIDNHRYSSPRREDVEAWRDDRLKNHEYYKELRELEQASIAEYYASKARWDNYTGD